MGKISLASVISVSDTRWNGSRHIVVSTLYPRRYHMVRNKCLFRCRKKEPVTAILKIYWAAE